MQAEKLVSITPHASQSDFRENCYDSALPHVCQSCLGSSWYVTTTSQIRQFCLCTTEMLQRRLRYVRFIDYQLRRLDDVSAWSRMFKLVTKMCQFLLITRQNVFATSQVVQYLLGTSQYVGTKSQDVCLIQVPVVTFLRRDKLVSLTQVPVGTLLRRLRLVGFTYVLLRRRKEVSNRSASLTYWQQRRDDASTWSAISQPILDLNEKSLRRRMPNGQKLHFYLQSLLL